MTRPGPRRPWSTALLPPGVALALALAGCGGTASTAVPSASAGSGTPTASGSSSAAPQTITISVHGTTVTPSPATVDVAAGRPVRLVVTADRSTQVHVHVLDLEKPITAGRPLTIEFTPKETGVYEVELHDPDLLLVKLAVR